MRFLVIIATSLPLCSAVTTYVRTGGYCADLCCENPGEQHGTMAGCTQTIGLYSAPASGYQMPDGKAVTIANTREAYEAWCTANPDCLGFGDHYSFDKVYLKSVFETNSEIKACPKGVGLSAGNNEPTNGCYVKVVTTTTTTTTTTAATTTTTEAKSSCGLTEWDLSEGELTGTSVTLSLANAAITVNTAHEFAKCTIAEDFEFALYEVDTVNGICSTTAVATGLWTTTKVFEPTPGKTGTTTARVSIVFSPAALAADLQQSNPQIYSKGGSADKNILSFCVRSAIKVDDYELRFSEMIVTATINTVFAIPAIENINVGRPKAKLATTAMDLLSTVNAYECYEDGDTFKGWLSGESKPALTTQNNMLTLCVTGVTTAVECKEFWGLSLKQGSKEDDVRVDDGANKNQLVTSVFGVQAIKDTNQVDYKGCAAQLLLDASYFDSAKPEKVTISGSVRIGLAARRRLLRDERSLHDNTKTTIFDVAVDRLQRNTSAGATTALTTAVLLVMAATVSM